MSVQAYITSLMTMWMSIWLIPDWVEALKVYVITASVLTAAIITMLFHWARLRDRIVDDIVMRVLMDPDIQKLIHERLQRAEFKRRLKQILRERKHHEDSKT